MTSSYKLCPELASFLWQNSPRFGDNTLGISIFGSLGHTEIGVNPQEVTTTARAADAANTHMTTTVRAVDVATAHMTTTVRAIDVANVNMTTAVKAVDVAKAHMTTTAKAVDVTKTQLPTTTFFDEDIFQDHERISSFGVPGPWEISSGAT